VVFHHVPHVQLAGLGEELVGVEELEAVISVEKDQNSFSTGPRRWRSVAITSPRSYYVRHFTYILRTFEVLDRGETIGARADQEV